MAVTEQCKEVGEDLVAMEIAAKTRVAAMTYEQLRGLLLVLIHDGSVETLVDIDALLKRTDLGW